MSYSVVSYNDTPTNVRSLEQRIRNLEGSDGLAVRRRVAMALVVVGQMLPEAAIKGRQCLTSALVHHDLTDTIPSSIGRRLRSDARRSRYRGRIRRSGSTHRNARSWMRSGFEARSGTSWPVMR